MSRCGVTDSYARSRYTKFFRDQRAPLLATGLWVDPWRSPNYLTPAGLPEFTQACNRTLYSNTDAAQEFEQERAIDDPTTGWRSPTKNEEDQRNAPLDLLLDEE